MTGGQRPVVVCHAGTTIARRLAGHPSRPRVIDDPTPGEPWVVPENATILITQPGAGWGRAPANPPPGWPYGLTWVHTMSVGVDAMPDWLASTLPLTCSRGVTADAIAEYVMAAVLGFDKGLHRVAVRDGNSWSHHTLGSVVGKTLGIVGFGAIGQAVACRAVPFGMRVLALRRGPWAEPPPAGVVPAVSIEDLLDKADHLVLALPHTPASHRLLDRARLMGAKPGLHLINIARGGLINHDALADALDRGILAGATLDTTDPEPLPPGHRLYQHERVLITPHISWTSPAVEESMATFALDAYDRFLSGAPLRNRVEPARGY